MTVLLARDTSSICAWAPFKFIYQDKKRPLDIHVYTEQHGLSRVPAPHPRESEEDMFVRAYVGGDP